MYANVQSLPGARRRAASGAPKNAISVLRPPVPGLLLPRHMENNNDGIGAAPPASGDAWLEQKVIDVVAEFSDEKREAVTREARLLDLTDSLGLTEIVMALEDDFEASMPDDDIGSIVTVGDLIDYVKAHFPSKASP